MAAATDGEARCEAFPVSSGTLVIDLALWHVGWGLSAASAGLVTGWLLRNRLDRALAVVMLGCTVWAIWILPDRRQIAVLFLSPLVFGLATVVGLRPPEHRVPVGPSLPTGRRLCLVRMDSSLVWVMTAITVGGVWLAVPDTDVNVVVMTSVIPLAGVAYWVRDRPPWTVRAGVVMLVVLGAISGAGGRTAWIGGLACVGLLPFRRKPVPWWLTLGVHWLVVLAACRVVSRWNLASTVLGSFGLVLGAWGVIEVSARARWRPTPISD